MEGGDRAKESKIQGIFGEGRATTGAEASDPSSRTNLSSYSKQPLRGKPQTEKPRQQQQPIRKAPPLHYLAIPCHAFVRPSYFAAGEIAPMVQKFLEKLEIGMKGKICPNCFQCLISTNAYMCVCICSLGIYYLHICYTCHRCRRSIRI